MENIINEFVDEDANIKAVVFIHPKGNAVKIQDLDCDEWFDCIKIFPELKDAIEYAEVCAGLRNMEGDYIYI